MDQVGPFALGAVLGSGGQGEVRRAVHRPTGTPVAVKLSRGPDAAAELATLAELDHPNVVRLWGAGLTSGSRWFAMELARTTLAAEPPRDWGTLRGVLERLLGALGHVHARGILHLDVKPQNVLLGCEDGPDELEPEALAGLRLSDFGLAGTDFAGKASGTVGYAPPEQLAARWRELGPATDLFALGEVAWQLATGVLRLPGTPTEVLRAQLRHAPTPFVPRVAVPADFEAWLRWLLEPNPVARPQRAVEALDALPDDLLPRRLAHASPLAAPLTWVDEPPTDVLRADSPAAGRLAPPTRPWQVREVWGRVRWLEGGGLGPVQTRLPRFTGRTAERERLWTLLQGVRATGRPAAVRITGAPGAGASRLAAWFGGRVHEADQAVVLRYGPGDDLASVLRRAARADDLAGSPLHERLRAAGASWGFPPDLSEALCEVVADGADPLPLIRRIPRERPLVVLHDDPTWSDAWNPVLAALLAEPMAPVLAVLVTPRVDAPGEVLTVGPLSVSEADPVLDRWMGLSRELADAVLVASAGVPGALVSLVAGLDADGRLRSTSDGFVADGPLPAAAPTPPPRADHPPSTAERALWAARHGRTEEARAAIDELVWSPYPPDLAAIALALEHRDPQHPATVLLPARLAARRGLLRGAVATASRVRDRAREARWTRVEGAALELLSWALTVPDRAGAVAAASQAEEAFRASGDLAGAARCRRRRATFELDPARREALLLPDLDDPALRAYTLVQLCSTDPLRWDEALRAAPRTDPWFAPECDRALAEAASLRGDHDEALRLLADVHRAERARLDRVWLGIVRLTAANVHRRRGATDEALAVCLTAMVDELSGVVEEAALVAAGICLLKEQPTSARRLLATGRRPKHPTLQVLRALLELATDLAEGVGHDAEPRWRAVWAPFPALASSAWLLDWRRVIEAPAARLGLELGWPGEAR